MLKWLRSIFGRCKNRWSHDWLVSNNGFQTEKGDTRACTVCGCRQVCVGHHSFMDADPIPQWEETTAPVTCEHNYLSDKDYNYPQSTATHPILVVCSRNNLYQQFKFRVCEKCKRTEVFDKGGWTADHNHLLLNMNQWEELKADQRKEELVGVAAKRKASGLSDRYYGIDEI